MALPQAEKLIARARQGDRLPSKERRHCVAFLQVAQPEASNYDLGELFQVDEKVIREDKKKIRQDRAGMIREDDITLVIADIVLMLDRNMRDVETSKKKARLGSRAYLEHCKTGVKMQLDVVKALQDLGYYPRNLGSMTVNKYEYKAVVSKDGSVDTRPAELSMADEDIIDAEVIEQKALPAPTEDLEIALHGN